MNSHARGAATPPPRILFCSDHGVLDPASGAARSTRDLLELLADRGWACGAVCGPRRDGGGPSLAADLQAEGLAVETRAAAHAGRPAVVHHLRTRGVPVSVYDPGRSTAATGPTGADTAGLLAVFEAVCDRFRPDVVLTYGGSAVERAVMAAANRRGLKVVFALHNFAYRGRDLFRPADAVYVPSAFARARYRATLGLESTVLPGPFAWDRVVCDRVAGRFVTVVNPTPEKGVFWTAGLIAALARRRPDVPFLVVEGRGGVDWLGRTGADLAGVETVSRMANTPDPRAFYAASRVVCVPSLVDETLGRVAIEALANGIPVVASDRGALSELLRTAGVCLPIPARFTPQSRVRPTAEELAPWAAAVQRLWDDETHHRAERVRALAAAEEWKPEALLPRFEAFFRAVVDGTAPRPFG